MSLHTTPDYGTPKRVSENLITLEIDGVGFLLPFTVRFCDEQVMRVACSLSRGTMPMRSSK